MERPVQTDIYDLNPGTEHLAGAVPAGRRDAARTRDLFYQALARNPGWRELLRGEFEHLLHEGLQEPGELAEHLLDAVEQTLMACQHADAVRQP